ncbi:hypothetical protein C8Q80DRAFT_1152825 [Daedaleopsis nitida]|nr:hypothetical protein C8Q80DRAFT_1152825 [Daedaleopsis nitida]
MVDGSGRASLRVGVAGRTTVSRAGGWELRGRTKPRPGSAQSTCGTRATEAERVRRIQSVSFHGVHITSVAPSGAWQVVHHESV